MELIDSRSMRGLGVWATREYYLNEWVLEFNGEHVTKKECLQLFKALRSKTSPYQLYFSLKGERLCVDATKCSFPGRYLNHSHLRPNLRPKVVGALVEGKRVVRVVFSTLRVVQSGQEFLFDYGERDPNVLKRNSWLVNS